MNDFLIINIWFCFIVLKVIENNHSILIISSLINILVKIKNLYRVNWIQPQSYCCQVYDHTPLRFCGQQLRCVKWETYYLISECKTEAAQLNMPLYGGDHTEIFKECSSFIYLRKRKSSIHRNLQKPKISYFFNTNLNPNRKPTLTYITFLVLKITIIIIPFSKRC